jgi:lipopolysaccharide export LptBFGC system permease protein LptF
MPTPSSAALLPSEPRGFRRLWRTVKQIFHEVVGAMFAVLAFGWLNSAFRAWTRDVAHWLIVMAVAVAGLFVLFAVGSFRRSRQL